MSFDEWIEEEVINRLFAAWKAEDEGDDREEENVEVMIQAVRKAIKEKVLESYHNGQAAGPKREFKRKEWR